jgi:hypothetical protein
MVDRAPGGIAMNKKTPSKKEMFEKLDSAIESLDEQRAAGLQKLKRLRLIQQAGLERELQRMGKKHGAEHPKVKKIAARITTNEGAMADLEKEIEKARIETPKQAANTWTVQGRVLDESAAGVEDLVVSLFDEAGNWVKDIEHTSTDELGYFAITYPVEEKEALQELEKKALFLTITDADRNVLHRESEPLSVEPGRMRFREVVLTTKDQEVRTPPETDEGIQEESSELWTARGVVVNEKGEGLEGLVISLFDKDLLFDDVLGTTKTAEDGSFEIIYRKEAFADLFESRPDLYVKVMDERGNVFYTSRKTVRFGAKPVETFEITIQHGMIDTMISKRKSAETDDEEQ